MKMKKCRVCGKNFTGKLLLCYKNMPKAAQFFPKKSNFKREKGIDLQVWQCNSCGVVQLSGAPVPYYKQVIRASGFSDKMKVFRERQFKDFIYKYSLRNKRIIEIGCGGGEYMSIMKKCGVKVYGIEHSKKLVKLCLSKGLTVINGFVSNENCRIKYSPYDSFYMLSFLEHIPFPGETLRGIYNNIVDEGVGLVEVPNFDMILRKELFSEFIMDHLLYFTKETLVRVLEVNGFDVLECKSIWYDYILSAVVKKRKLLDLSSFYDKQKVIETDIKKYIYKFKSIAIWGAGHQSLSIISLLNLKNKIKYIIDSATFKQGKYSPATHIPIVSPQQAKMNPVESIIVIAGSYSDEVANIIKREFDKNIKVAILKDFGLEVV